MFKKNIFKKLQKIPFLKIFKKLFSSPYSFKKSLYRKNYFSFKKAKMDRDLVDMERLTSEINIEHVLIFPISNFQKFFNISNIKYF
jgi:hypothetical protein